MRQLLLIFALLFVIDSTHAQNEPVGIVECDTAACKNQFKEFRKFARNGSPHAQLTIASMYYAGYGVERNVNESLKWFRKASKHGGAAFSRYRAGMIYLFDPAIEQDIDKGMEFLTRAADTDHPQAAYVLASIYINGKLVEKDMMKGLQWLQVAAKLGDPEALYDLARFYEDGITGKNETAAAISLYKAAAPKHQKARERLLELKAINQQDDIFASTRNNGIEKITVTAPELSKLLITSLDSIKASGRFNRAQTCSRLASTPCGTQVAQLVAPEKIQHVFDGVFYTQMRNFQRLLEE